MELEIGLSADGKSPDVGAYLSLGVCPQFYADTREDTMSDRKYPLGYCSEVKYSEAG
jgi:hypothetical protein